MEYDKSKDLLRLLNLGCELHDGIFYPRGLFCQSILDMLNEAFQICKLPTIEFDPNMSIIITDYRLEAPSLYFNVNIVEIDREAREAFPYVKFTVRWRYMLPSFCYLILENDTELKAAEQSGDVEKIIAFISAYCKTRDPLHIFDEIEIRPEVVSKSSLDKKEIIAILRDHTGFTSC